MMMPDLDKLRALLADMDADMDIWDERGDEPNARIRRAGNELMTGIDKALAELHRIRARVVGEIRAADAANAARVDAQLAEHATRLAVVTGEGSPNPLIAHPPAGTWNEHT
jgi:hypothetical protein